MLLKQCINKDKFAYEYDNYAYEYDNYAYTRLNHFPSNGQ